MPGPIVAALDILQDAILAALAPVGAAWWNEAPADTTRRLRLAPGEPPRLPVALIPYCPDPGAVERRYLRVEGWAGRVAVRCLAADTGDARAARDAAHAALAATAAPAGYALGLRYAGPLPTLSSGGVTQVGSVYAATIRRVAVAPALAALLLEDGGALLLEDGARLLLETT
jgi:hypothetical protein